MKSYKIGFSVWGALLFLIIMVPTWIWFAFPAPNDILRAESQTELTDTIASVCQILFIAALCLIVKQNCGPLKPTPLITGVMGCIVLYYAGWFLYYGGLTDPFVILLLTAPPCGAFLLFALDQGNKVALVSIVIFSVCHLFYGIVNFMVFE